MPENLEQALNIAITVYNALKLEGDLKGERTYRPDARTITCYGCNKKGHIRRDCRAARGGYPRNTYRKEAKYEVDRTDSRRHSVQCWECGRLGHIARDCTKRKLPTTRTKQTEGAIAGKQTPN
jgi:hypothetical protein